MRRLLMFVCLIGLQFGLISISKAGSWATTPITELSDTIVADQIFKLEFSVLEYGTKPTNGLKDNPIKPEITARHVHSLQVKKFYAQQVGTVGHFQSRLQLPDAGEWEISIMPMPFGTIEGEVYRITVLEAVAPQTANWWYMGMAGSLGLVVGMGWLIKRSNH